MKVKYKGKNIIPIELAIGIIPQFTNGKIYEVLENLDEKYYVVLDDNNKKRLLEKEQCDLLKEGE